MSLQIVTGHAFEDSGVVLLGRIRGGDGDNIQQADIASIAYSVYEVTVAADGTETVADTPATGTLVKTTVVFDALQTDSRWGADGDGYNFRWDVPASLIPNGGKRYEFEVLFTPVSGEQFPALWHVQTRSLRRS